MIQAQLRDRKQMRLGRVRLGRREKKSYRDLVIGRRENEQEGSEVEDDEGDVSDDDVIEEGDDKT